MDHVCAHLLNISQSHHTNRKQKLIWMKPIPPRFNLTSEQTNQFQQIIKTSDCITQKYGFKSFDRYFIWEHHREELLINNSHHFGPQGNSINNNNSFF